MKKEFIFAILVGLVMGLFITYGIYYSQRSTEQEQVTTTMEQLEKTETEPDSNASGQLTIYSPEDEIITAETTTDVTGKTLPQAFVVIFVNDKPILTQADETGNFAKEINLQKLANIIRIYAIDNDGEEYVVERTVIVYDQELESELTSEIEEEDSDNNG